MPKSDILNIALAAGAIAVTFLLSPMWGWVFAVIAVIGFSAYFGIGMVLPNPRIQEWPVHNALNLRITNRHSRQSLANDELTLVSLRWWEPLRAQFMAVRLADEKETPFILLADDVHLHY